MIALILFNISSMNGITSCGWSWREEGEEKRERRGGEERKERRGKVYLSRRPAFQIFIKIYLHKMSSALLSYLDESVTRHVLHTFMRLCGTESVINNHTHKQKQ